MMTKESIVRRGKEKKTDEQKVGRVRTRKSATASRQRDRHRGRERE